MTVTVIKNNNGALGLIKMSCPTCSSVIEFTTADATTTVTNATATLITVTCPVCQNPATKTINKKVHEQVVSIYPYDRLPI